LQYNCMQKYSSKILWASKVHVPSFFQPKKLKNPFLETHFYKEIGSR
jgi:hypothetical protein